MREVNDILYQYALEMGSLSGGMNQLPENLQREAFIDFMVTEAIKTSQIEGENINSDDVRSSLLNQLGLAPTPLTVKDPRSAGITQLIIDVQENYNNLLTEEMIFSWHKMILPTAFQEKYFEVGAWRTHTDPMQIISGPIGKEKIHFEAPSSKQVPVEMKRFIAWFNETHPTLGQIKIPGPVRAAIVHLYFESIHPFRDGNGRVGRALAEMALSQDIQRPILLSLSETIHKNKKNYYHELSKASAYQIDITSWVTYFVKTIFEALLTSKEKISFVFKKAHFWNKYNDSLNDRQRRVIHRLFAAGIEGYEGGMSTRKYIKICDCSPATATRDLADLYQKGCIVPLPGSGRSTRYALNLAGSLLTHTRELKE